MSRVTTSPLRENSYVFPNRSHFVTVRSRPIRDLSGGLQDRAVSPPILPTKVCSDSDNALLVLVMFREFYICTKSSAMRSTVTWSLGKSVGSTPFFFGETEADNKVGKDFGEDFMERM